MFLSNRKESDGTHKAPVSSLDNAAETHIQSFGSCVTQLVAVDYSQVNRGSSFSSALLKDKENVCYVKRGKQSVYLVRLGVHVLYGTCT